MKNETARREIESLDYYLQNHTNDYSEESHMAMMMAIKALEQQPSETIHGSTYGGVSWGGTYTFKAQQPCEDCISREEAISVIQDKYYDHAVGIDIVDMIARMPAAIPEQLGEHFAEGYKKGIENE